MRRHRILITTLTALAPLVAALLGPPASSLGEPDETPPTVRIDPWAHFRVGSQIETNYDPSGLENYWWVELVARWRVGDPSGICEQVVAWHSYEEIGGETDPVLGPDTGQYPVANQARTFLFFSDLLNHARIQDRVLVRATDCAGNTGTSGVAEVVFASREDTSRGVRYRGAWRVSRSAGFSGGTTHRTRQRGARFTATFQGADGPVALVMVKARKRGRAAVYVDGVRRATVDTYALAKRHRMVVWEGLFRPGRHTLRVVNLATPGRPRIDVDAVLTCTPPHGLATCEAGPD